MGNNELLIFVPTYNEAKNVEPLFQRLNALDLPGNILFLDDNSPDGTGDKIDSLCKKNPKVRVIHRALKSGIGSAHKEGINYAYKNGYKTLVTMDADFTHPPETIPELISEKDRAPVVIASRYLEKESLKGWHIIRRILTNIAHFLTRALLGLKYDSTGALRLYRLDTIPQTIFDSVESDGYSFFFESLYILHRNKFNIVEIPVILPPRIHGSSKMSYYEIFHSVGFLFALSLKDAFSKFKR